jgi:3',5'-cyclic AMP phosphodiesterase CpdA
VGIIARIAHLSDPHLGPLPPVRLGELFGKRITGYLNWRLHRQSTHDMSLLAEMVRDLAAQGADAVCCTGDVANIGLPGEFEAARKFLDSLGPQQTVGFVPGNHDAYVSGSLDRVFQHLRPWMTGEMPSGSPFPYIRRHEQLAIIGLCSGVPTPLFRADGKLGKAQILAAGQALDKLKDEGLCRVIAVHHPPHVGGAKPGRGLHDAADFEDMLATHGAELVLHGHNHISSLNYRPGPLAHVPILGVPSLSNRTGVGLKRAGYHMIEISRMTDAYAISVTTRGMTENGTIGPINTLQLAP